MTETGKARCLDSLPPKQMKKKQNVCSHGASDMEFFSHCSRKNAKIEEGFHSFRSFHF